MPRKCHIHRQQTNQWHPEEEIHKVNICCTYSLEASQYETLQSLIEMSPMSAPGVCFFLQHYSESCHVVHQIKENKEKKTCPHPPPPPPLTPKKNLTLTLPDTKKINVFQNQSK